LHKGSLILQSKRSEISKLEDLLYTLNEFYGINQERFINFHIAVSEALINAIVHGNKESAEKRVIVDIYENEDSLEVVVKDEGEGFNQNILPDPTETENLNKESGRGVYIMKMLTDGYECCTDSTGTTVKLGILFEKQ
jgi:serine/threonine-protein kinase RsbW